MKRCKHKWEYIGGNRKLSMVIEWCELCGALRISNYEGQARPAFRYPRTLRKKGQQ